MNKTFILPCAKHPGKSYRSRHNKSCQGLTKTKTLAGERSPKTETEDPLEKKGRKRCKYVIFPVYFGCLVCFDLGPSYMVSGTRDNPPPEASLSNVYI